MNDKVIVTGSGNCGTTFLMKLFTELRLDTGWTPEHLAAVLSGRPQASCEWIIRGTKALEHQPQPYIIKCPKLCYDLRDRIDRWDWNVKHIFIPIRKWEHVAAHKHTQYFGRLYQPPKFRESFHKDRELTEKEFRDYHAMKAASAIGCLMLPLVEDEIPHTFMLFPRIVTDPEYLFRKVEFVLGGIDYAVFLEAFNKIADRRLVHHE